MCVNNLKMSTDVQFKAQNDLLIRRMGRLNTTLSSSSDTLMDSMCLQLVIDQIVFGFEFFATRFALVPHGLIDKAMHISNVLLKIACIRINFAAMQTLWSICCIRTKTHAAFRIQWFDMVILLCINVMFAVIFIELPKR